MSAEAEALEANARFCLDAAELRRKANDWKGAIEFYEKAIAGFEEAVARGFPRERIVLFQTPDFYYNLALVCEATGELETAVRWLRKALEISPEDADALFNAGMFSCRLGDFAAGVDFLQRHLAVDPRSEETQRALLRARAEAVRATGQAPEARPSTPAGPSPEAGNTERLRELGAKHPGQLRFLRALPEPMKQRAGMPEMMDREDPRVVERVSRALAAGKQVAILPFLQDGVMVAAADNLFGTGKAPEVGPGRGHWIPAIVIVLVGVLAALLLR